MLKLFPVLVLAFLMTACVAGPHPHTEKGWAYLGKKDNQAAIAEFLVDPGPSSYLGLYRAYMNMNDIETAKRYLEKGLNEYPQDGHLNFAAGYFHLTVNKNYKAAIYFFKRAQKELQDPGIERMITETEIMEDRRIQEGGKR